MFASLESSLLFSLIFVRSLVLVVEEVLISSTQECFRFEFFRKRLDILFAGW